MENENPSNIHAFTKQYEFIAPAIYTIAGVCPSDLLIESETLLQDDSKIRWETALWDTGATHSCISGRLAEELGLAVEGFVAVATATGIVQLFIYTVNLVLPSRQVFQNLQVAGFPYTDNDCEIIIGMDIMTQGDLALTNMEGRTLFSFRIPSLHTVDFEAEHSQ